MFVVREAYISWQHGGPIKGTPQYDSAVMYMGFQEGGGFQLGPHDVESLSVSCISGRCYFYSLDECVDG